jgi:hypothetical protein
MKLGSNVAVFAYDIMDSYGGNGGKDIHVFVDNLQMPIVVPWAKEVEDMLIRKLEEPRIIVDTEKNYIDGFKAGVEYALELKVTGGVNER